MQTKFYYFWNIIRFFVLMLRCYVRLFVVYLWLMYCG